MFARHEVLVERARQRRLEIALRDVADAAGSSKPAELDVRVQVRAHRYELLLNRRVLDLIAEVRLTKIAADPQRSGKWHPPSEETGRAIRFAESVPSP